MRTRVRIEQLERRFGQPLEQTVAVCVNSAGNVVEKLVWIGGRSVVIQCDGTLPAALFSCKVYHGLLLSDW